MRALSGRAKVSAKGWIVIPKEIRDEMDLKPGDEVQFSLWPPADVMKQDKRLSSLQVHKTLPRKELVDLLEGAFEQQPGRPAMTASLLSDRAEETEREEQTARAMKKRRKTSA